MVYLYKHQLIPGGRGRKTTHVLWILKCKRIARHCPGNLSHSKIGAVSHESPLTEYRILNCAVFLCMDCARPE